MSMFAPMPGKLWSLTARAGTTFTVRLPLQQIPPDVRPEALQRRVPEGFAS